MSEEQVTYDGNSYHRVTLLHEAQIPSQVYDEIRHKEFTDVKMTWRSLDQLATKEVKTGIFDFL